MRTAGLGDLDLNIARGRIALSLLAFLSLYLDPSTGGLFRLDTWVLITLGCHLAYSVSTYLVLNLRLCTDSQ